MIIIHRGTHYHEAIATLDRVYMRDHLFSLCYIMVTPSYDFKAEETYVYKLFTKNI